MKKILSFLLCMVVSVPCFGANLSALNGKTISGWNGKTWGTSSGNVNAWNGLLAAGGGGGSPNFVFKGMTTGTTIVDDHTFRTTESLNIATGDLVICYSASTPGTSVAVTCGGSNTLTQAKLVSSSDPYDFGAYVKTGATAYNGTCSFNSSPGTNYNNIWCVNYGSVSSTGVLDKTSCNTAGCDAASSSSTSLTAVNTATTTQANELLVAGVLRWNKVADFTQVSPYIFRGKDNTLFGLFDTSVSATGTYPNQTFGTTSDADTYLSIFLTFKDQ